ncbi:MAG: FlgD immunoglobulin-like domain containing protein, partial [Candidatus Poribacteria bacterium]
QDGSLARNGLSVTVTNLTTGVILSDTTGKTAGNGRYGVRFVDLTANRAAAVGDVLEIAVMVGDETIGEQRYTLTQAEIDAFSLVTEVRIEKATFTIQLSEGINLISLPLVPKQEWRMSDLARFIGPEVKMIIFHQHQGCKLVSYSPNDDALDSIYNAPLTDNAAYIVIMDAPKAVTFTGTPWSGDVLLKECYNFIGVPLEPVEPWTLKSLADFVGPGLDWIIVYDKESEHFVSYNPKALGASSPSIRGGEGYILVMTAGTQLKFSGKAWENIPAAESTPVAVAPLLATNWRDDPSKLALVTVEGDIRLGDDGTALNGLELHFHNLTAGWKITSNERNIEDGRYRLTYADFEHNRAVRVGDLLEVTVVDPSHAFSSEVIRHTVTSEDLQQERIVLKDVLLLPIPKQSALLANYPNPFNPETWIPYKLSEESTVVIRIYNVSGQLVRTLSLGKKAADVYARKSKAAYWDGRNDAGERVASGIYFYTLKADDFQATRRMLIVK